jgi:Fe-S-cluster containining protein
VEAETFLHSISDRKDLDELFNSAHDVVFASTDCLECANCCKTTSPILLQEDLDRLASVKGMSTGTFMKTYVQMDEDGDFVFKAVPCPMLQEDNKCSVYEDRPKACREYPHTNRKDMHEILDLTAKNALVCPAVEEIVDRIQSTLRPWQ